MKPIHFYLYDGKGLFSNKNDHVCYTVVTCDKTESCGFYKQGCCARTKAFGGCPHGNSNRVNGPTRRARSCYDFMAKARETYRDVPSLKRNPEAVALVGDYVYLPLQHLRNYSNSFSSAKIHSDHFVLKSDLTPQIIVDLINYRPEALFGGEIQSYQKECVPIFLRGMQETLSELLASAVELRPSIKARLASITNVGRKALLRTLKPMIGELVDIHGGHWVYDGEYLTSKDSHAAFLLVSGFSEIRIRPSAGVEVTITDDKQVDTDTIFTS